MKSLFPAFQWTFQQLGVAVACIFLTLGIVCLNVLPCQAQIFTFVNSGTVRNDLRGRDFVVTAPPSFPITMTIENGGLISSNADASDGYEGVEVFLYSEVHMNGGAIVPEDGRKGGLRLHDYSSVTVNGGSLDYLWQRDLTASSFWGGLVNECLIQDRSAGYLYGGSVASLTLLGQSRFEVNGGLLGSGGVQLFGRSRVLFYGSDFRIHRPRTGIVNGVSGIFFYLTGVLSDGGALATNVFIEGGQSLGNGDKRLFFNDVPATVAVAAPDAPSGVLVVIGAAWRMLVANRRRFAR